MDGIYLIKADGTVKNLRRFVADNQSRTRQLIEAVIPGTRSFDITYTKLFHEPGGVFAIFKENTITCIVEDSPFALAALDNLVRIASHEHWPAELSKSPCLLWDNPIG